MICPTCGFDNPDQMKFCGECGTRLVLQTEPRSPRLRPSAALWTESEAPAWTADRRGSVPEAERRQLTVMFCDLVGTHPLADQLDPEELGELVRESQEICAEVIARYDGHIAQYLSDGLMVYFGYPFAHEDDARRAVSSALGILVAFARRPPHLARRRHVQQPLRFGIHTGIVVVGEMGSVLKHELLALGHAPNIAARLMSLAERNTIVISTATFRLIRGFFVCESLGQHQFKGLPDPMEVFRVLRESDVVSRLEVEQEGGLTPLVGKEQELKALHECWAQAVAGRGQFVLLTGEPGIGKSRLVRAFIERLPADSYLRVECHCSPYYQNTALFPFADLLRRMLDFGRDESLSMKLRKLEDFLRHQGFFLPEAVPLFAGLLHIPFEEHYPELGLSAQRERHKLVHHLQALLLQFAARQPTLLVIEDLHWLDPSTLDLLNHLLKRITTTRMLVVLAYRPAFIPPWPAGPHVTYLHLHRLPPPQVEVMVAQVTGGRPLPREVLDQLVQKTDGVPLFIEELTKMVLESGLVAPNDDRYELTGPLPPLAIPSTLQDSLMARLDRLSTVKEVVHVAAVLGREFSYELMRHVSQLDEATLRAELARLVEAELFTERGTTPRLRFAFRHALIQEAAYQSLLKSTRQAYHRRVAHTLLQHFPEIVTNQPEVLAHHYTEAGMKEQAVAYWQWAGEQALERSAHEEAISHLTLGLELLKSLPESSERRQLELDLLTTLGPALMTARGYAAPAVEQAYARALELCRAVDEPPRLFPALWGLWIFHLTRADLVTARRLADQLVHLAQQMHDTDWLLEAHHALGVTFFWLGELVQARAHLEQGFALYDFQEHAFHALAYGQEPGVVFLSHLSLAAWLLGYPDQGRQKALALAQLACEISQPFDQVFAHLNVAMLHQFLGEVTAAQERAGEVIAMCTEQGFPLWLALGNMISGWALARTGKTVGARLLRQGLAAYEATGAMLARPYYLALLAEVLMADSQWEEAEKTLAEALAEVDENGERLYVAELHRLKGEWYRAQAAKPGEQAPALAQAEACFQEALQWARLQQAKSLELRAAMSLAGLWQQQGKNAQARELLAGVYERFTEGFETLDLREARAMLAELAEA